jgi:hypothetical protein
MSASAYAFRLNPSDDVRRESPVNGASTSITSFDFGLTLDEIRELLTEEDEDDRPSDLAFNRAMLLLRQAAERTGLKFPRAIAATGPGRSVRLIWMREQRKVRLMIGGSAANRSYIYWRKGPESGVDENIKPEYLAAYLEWLNIDS